MEKKLRIEHFTDPLCSWCYAMEPEMRKDGAVAALRQQGCIVD